MNETPAQRLRARMRTDLLMAMKARDTAIVAALRSALAGIDNAEAVAPAESFAIAVSEHVAAAGVGVGATESMRRLLSVDDLQSVLHTLITEFGVEAGRYDGYGQADAAQRLRSEAEALRRYVD